MNKYRLPQEWIDLYKSQGDLYGITDEQIMDLFVKIHNENKNEFIIAGPGWFVRELLSRYSNAYPSTFYQVICDFMKISIICLPKIKTNLYIKARRNQDDN